MTLASALAGSERDLRAAEAKVEELLTALFPAWKGWKFIHGQGNRYGIEVFEASWTPHARRTLFGAGFTTVTIHPHGAGRILTCTCVSHDAY